MLTQLRLKSQNLMISIVFGMLIFVFIFFFGPQSQGFQPGGSASIAAGTAAKVDGVEIPAQHVEIGVRRLGDIEADDLPRLRREALAQVIEQELLAQRAQKAGLAVSEDELSGFIIGKENRDFALFADRSGRFDYKRFESWVTQGFGTSTGAYRAAKERELLAERYVRFLEQQVIVSDAEVRQAFDLAKRTWNLSYVVFEPSKHAEGLAKPTAAQGVAYAAKHGDDIKAYYDKNKKSYDHETEVRVSRVLVKVGKDDAAKKAAAKTKIDGLLAQASAPGADFKKIARDNSEGYFAKFGGDMGWQSMENTAKSDYAVYTTLKAGTLSAVQETPIGFWFVRAEEVKPAIKKTLDEVKGEIGAILMASDLQKAAANKAAAAALARLKAGETMDVVFAAPKPEPVVVPPVVPEGETPVVAEGETPPPPPAPKKPAITYTVRKTGPFSHDRPVWDRIPGIGKSAALATKLDGLTEKAPLIEQIIELEDGGQVLVRLDAKTEPKDEDFAKEREQFSQRLRSARLMQLFGNWRAVLFGGPNQREIFRKFAGGALLATLDSTKHKITINQALYPIPQPPVVPASAAKK
jgi:hypothetical protein